MSQRQVILLACIAEHCHGTQEKPEAKPTQNKHKPKTNTLSPQILLVCKNKLQTRIVFCLTIKRVSTIFFPVKSVFNGIPNLLPFCFRKVNKSNRRRNQKVSAKVDRTKDKILIWPTVYQLCFLKRLLLTLIFKAWLILVWIWFLHHLDYRAPCFAADSIQHFILYFLISFLFKSKILPRIGSFPFR